MVKGLFAVVLLPFVGLGLLLGFLAAMIWLGIEAGWYIGDDFLESLRELSMQRTGPP